MSHYFRSSINTVVVTLLSLLALLFLGPWLLHNQTISTWQHTLTQSKPWCIALHLFFYLSVLLVWPKVINNLTTKAPLSAISLKTLNTLPWYLIAVFLLIDALVLWSTSSLHFR